MGIYLGYIQTVGSEPTLFYNFKPLYQYKEHSLLLLSSEERRALLPDSEKGEINFYYNFSDTAEYSFMKKMFSNTQIIAFEFVIDDLEANYNRYGERNPTGYKIETYEMVETNKIIPLSDLQIYLLIQNENARSDFYKDTIVEIDGPGLRAGIKVLFKLEDDFFAGPYTVEYRTAYRGVTPSFYILPKIKENKYIVTGYQKSDCQLQEFAISSGWWENPSDKLQIVLLHKDASPVFYDQITDEALLSSFKDSLDSRCIGDGQINMNHIEELLQHYHDSAFTGGAITDSMRKKRLSKLKQILTDESDLDSTLSHVAQSLCDLIVKYKNTAKVDDFLQTIIDKSPDFIEKMQSSRIIIEKRTQFERDALDRLRQEKNEIAQSISSSHEKTQLIEQLAIEQKTKELLATDTEYTEKKAKLDAILRNLETAEGIENLSFKLQDIKKEVSDQEIHKQRLANDSKNLEAEFLKRINNFHDQMVGIAFDGFMANKMLESAARWEAAGEERSYVLSVDALNAIPVVPKSPAELIKYLCKTVQIARPQYRHNTIINIAICISQSFLTVFSGEPGCGKTSICNIVAEVFGLNKISEIAPRNEDFINQLSRYVSVSVERGWTSKKDFIGYFNPLSKTFDKGNSQVYDGLKLLSTEQQKHISNFPFLVLLDEANLSPMEYYWADFMNVCDDLQNNSQINLGGDSIFFIPETLRFMATINNDHTTEVLSPRLVDRAWIITLPQFESITLGTAIPNEQIDIISWHSIRDAFLPNAADSLTLSAEIQKIYDVLILPHLRKANIVISPRTDIAIKKYWIVASKHLEDEILEDGTIVGAAIVALDYAMAQKILPKIAGNGEEFAKWLDELRSICSSNNLIACADMIKDMIARGDKQMKYYQFFG